MPTALSQHYASKIKNDPNHQYVKVCTGRFYDKSGTVVPKDKIKDMSKVKMVKPASDKVKERIASKPSTTAKPKTGKKTTGSTIPITGKPLTLKVVRPLRKQKDNITHTIPQMVHTTGPSNPFVKANTNNTIPISQDFVVQGPPIVEHKPLHLNVIRNAAGSRKGGMISQPSNGLLSGKFPKKPTISK